METEQLADRVCLSRWASCRSSDARRFRPDYLCIFSLLIENVFFFIEVDCLSSPSMSSHTLSSELSCRNLFWLDYRSKMIKIPLQFVTSSLCDFLCHSQKVLHKC